MRVICVLIASVALVAALPAQLVPRFDRRGNDLEAAIYNETLEDIAMDPVISDALDAAFAEEIPVQADAAGIPAAQVAQVVDPNQPLQPVYAPAPLQQGYQAPMAPVAAMPAPAPASAVVPAPIPAAVPVLAPPVPAPAAVPASLIAQPHVPVYNAPSQVIPAMPEANNVAQYAGAPIINGLAQPQPPAVLPPQQLPIAQPAASAAAQPQVIAQQVPVAAPASLSPVPLNVYATPGVPPAAVPGQVADYQTQTGADPGLTTTEQEPADSNPDSSNPVGKLVMGISNGLGDLLNGIGGIIKPEYSAENADDPEPVAQPDLAGK
ncbi:hypothetical protein LPJ64_000455 [Coemansia asiatica]|uniref:Uncharacterized protein n=1 Tax=Coemansia asiatica TaxID=1052880 RepID=A0A9W8CME8_9FUNG|nr:hypothetical protein LPJ64_000455 [Coemansia asiatica]